MVAFTVDSALLSRKRFRASVLTSASFFLVLAFGTSSDPRVGHIVLTVRHGVLGAGGRTGDSL